MAVHVGLFAVVVGVGLVIGALPSTRADQVTIPKRVIGLSIVCDLSCNNALKKWYPDPRQFLSNVAQQASMRLSNTSINVVIGQLQVWNLRNLIKIPTDSDALMSVLSTYRQQVMLPQRWSDAFLLITAEAVTSATSDPTGKYLHQGICSKRNAVGYIRYEYQSERSFAATLAHELGHGLGMLHDKSGCCPTLGYGNCVMGPYLNTRQLQQSVFGPCSERYYKRFLAKPRSWCIDDLPKYAFSMKTTCGNGIVDGDEQCDCGQGCLDGCCNCCDEQTCRFKPEAQCASGPCCNVTVCKFLSPMHVCRQKNDTACDYDDTCSGNDTQCMETYKDDGTDCAIEGDTTGYCYGGICLTRDNQCKRTYMDSNYKEAPSICFTSSKTAPDRSSHCGVLPNKVYRACAGNYSHWCGVLQCTPPGLRNSYFATTDRNMRRNYNHYSSMCYYGHYGDWEMREGPIFVADGTKCGDQKVCYKAMCIDKKTAYESMKEYVGPVEKPNFCGNGIIEDTETCDCGGFQCECCDPVTCQLKPLGSPCTYTGGCTMGCDGIHTACATMQLEDFTPCVTRGTAALGQCYDGICASRDGACKKAFGSDARAVHTTIVNRTANAYSNAGGFKLFSHASQDWHPDEEYAPINSEDSSCGILVCSTTNMANIKSLKTRTWNVHEKKNHKVFYYTRGLVYKGGRVYERYYPALVDQGTACVIDGEPGYCNTANLKISRSGWNWYWYAKCMPVTGRLYRANAQWNY